MRNMLCLALFFLFAMPSMAFAQDVDGDGVDAALDCDDNDAANYPGNLEICDGQDNDCNGLADYDTGIGGVWEQVNGNAINNPDFTKGDVFLASTPTTVASFGVWLDVDPAATLTLTLGESSSDSGPYTILASQNLGNVAPGPQMHSATGLNVSLTPGMYYWIGATWNGGNADNFYNGTGADTDPPWGTFVTGAWASSNVAPINGWSPDSLPGGCYRAEIVAVGAGEGDADGDGWVECEECDDTDPLINPDAVEVCDGADTDCNGAADFDLLGETDNDDDTWLTCDGDCNDSYALAYPGAPEICDGEDNDCNGLADFDVLGEVDLDMDTFFSCEDCDDNDQFVRPGAPERCDGLDNDCNGVADFGGAVDETDLDMDGWYDCEDCDDNDPTINPEAIELCDGLDNDCNGRLDFGESEADELDADGDGFVLCDDCDDTNGAVFPGAVEECDGTDNDCDGMDALNELQDLDGDSFSTCQGDCDDADVTTYTGAAEICDSIDNDCDGEVDNTAECDELAAEAAKQGECSCSTNGSSPAGWMLLLALVAVRRRR